jgi:hypothetical protein
MILSFRRDFPKRNYGGYPAMLVAAIFFERDGPGEEQVLPVVWPVPAQAPNLRQGRRCLSLLLFRQFSINFLF